MNCRVIVSVCTLFSAVACTPAIDQEQDAATDSIVAEPLATAPMMNGEGGNVGLASIVRFNGALALNVSLSSMPSGEKAFHLHTIGACDAPGFKSAGGHLNPNSVSHGELSETGPHLGDFPNITIAEDGLAEFSFPIEGNAETALSHLFDQDGTAVMIHAGPDDYKSDPAGAAGPRIACGVLVKA